MHLQEEKPLIRRDMSRQEEEQEQKGIADAIIMAKDKDEEPREQQLSKEEKDKQEAQEPQECNGGPVPTSQHVAVVVVCLAPSTSPSLRHILEACAHQFGAQHVYVLEYDGSSSRRSPQPLHRSRRRRSSMVSDGATAFRSTASMRAQVMHTAYTLKHSNRSAIVCMLYICIVLGEEWQ